MGVTVSDYQSLNLLLCMRWQTVNRALYRNQTPIYLHQAGLVRRPLRAIAQIRRRGDQSARHRVRLAARAIPD